METMAEAPTQVATPSAASKDAADFARRVVGREPSKSSKKPLRPIDLLATYLPREFEQDARMLVLAVIVTKFEAQASTIITLIRRDREHGLSPTEAQQLAKAQKHLKEEVAARRLRQLARKAVLNEDSQPYVARARRVVEEWFERNHSVSPE